MEGKTLWIGFNLPKLSLGIPSPGYPKPGEPLENNSLRIEDKSCSIRIEIGNEY